MSRYEDEEFDLNGPRGKSGEEGAGFFARSAQLGNDVSYIRGYWEGSISDRLKVARGVPQAVVKITSHNHGRIAVKARLDYISREGELMIETETGERLLGKEDTQKLLNEWVEDFGSRKNGRDATCIVLSFPKDVDHGTAYSIAQEFLEEQYRDNYRYAFAAHEDTDNYHVHAVIKTVGLNGGSLPTYKADLREWRINMAEKAREHGLALDASPRFARGRSDNMDLSFFQTERIDPWIKGAHVKALDRGNIGIVVDADKEQDRYSVQFVNPNTESSYTKIFSSEELAVVRVPREAIKRAREDALAKSSMPEDTLKQARARNSSERVKYAKAALKVAKDLPKLKDPDVIDKSINAIRDLTRYARDMDGPQNEKPGEKRSREVVDVIRDYISSSVGKDSSQDREREIDDSR
tara:strand:+ start:6638 stop:7864 length:1227 start_codon:yes stop_codon:yes gene_type:complete